jgi:hypothetical protein
MNDVDRVREMWRALLVACFGESVHVHAVLYMCCTYTRISFCMCRMLLSGRADHVFCTALTICISLLCARMHHVLV